MKIILVFAVPAAVAVIYAFWLRGWLKQHPTFKPYCDWIEAIAATLWARSRTILSARLYWIAGTLIGLHDFVAPILLSSGLEWQAFIPPEYQRLYPLMLIATGLLFEGLRHVTREPLEAKE
jgi:hypothetical protein